MRIFIGILLWGLLIFPGFSQIDFDPTVKNWMKYYGDPNAVIYKELALALKSKGTAQKLYAEYEVFGKNWGKLSKVPALNYVFIKNNGITDIPAGIGYLSSLEIFVSHQNRIDYIDSAIVGCSKLKILEIRGAALDSIPREFRNMRYLEVLRIMENEKDTLYFSDSLIAIPNLKAFQCYKTPMFRFPAFLANSPKVEFIMIQNGMLKAFPDSLMKMQALKTLDLERNEITEIPKTILQCKNIEYLNLRNNKLSHIPDWIARMPNLQYLDIRGNNISVEELDLIITLLKYKAVVISDYLELKNKYDNENAK